MATVVFRLVAGPAFILLGRWLYRNPARFYPAALYTNPRHPLLALPVRFLAALMMVGGSFAVLTLATEHLREGAAGALLTLALAVVAAWLLRPRAQHAPPQPAGKEGRGLITPAGKRLAWAWLLLVAGLAAALIVFESLR